MDFSAIWNAITENLATASLFSVGGVLWAGIKWAHHRFNKKHRFKMLQDDVVDAVRAISFYQRSRVKNQNLDARASYLVDTEDVIVERLRSLQGSLRPLGVYLFKEGEMDGRWILAADKPLEDGRAFEPLGQERIQEIGRALTLVSRLIRAGDYKTAKEEFPPSFDVARLRFSNEIKGERTAKTKRVLEAHRIEDSRPVLPARPS